MTALAGDYYRQYLDAARTHWWFRGRERVVKVLAEPLVMEEPGVVVADIGSGPGGPARAIFPTQRLIAFDVSPLPLQANQQADGRVVADAAQMPCRSSSLDAVCAFDLLEHLDDDAAALREWRRLLRPGGMLVLTVPAYGSLWSAHDDVNGHRRRYHAASLKPLLAGAGFTVVRMTYFNTLLLPAVALVRWAERLFKARAAAAVGEAPEGHLDCQRRFPTWIERCCESAFVLEARWLRRHHLGAGVSLCAIARTLPPPTLRP